MLSRTTGTPPQACTPSALTQTTAPSRQRRMSRASGSATWMLVDSGPGIVDDAVGRLE